jgi:hypothetical protein
VIPAQMSVVGNTLSFFAGRVSAPSAPLGRTGHKCVLRRISHAKAEERIGKNYNERRSGLKEEKVWRKKPRISRSQPTSPETRVANTSVVSERRTTARRNRNKSVLMELRPASGG